VSEVARQSSIRNLLGTETCEEMVAAQLPNFDKIITIDPDDRLCSSVLKRFAPHPNFDVANGASHQILPRVLLRFRVQCSAGWKVTTAKGPLAANAMLQFGMN
jgi:hypothetical protein